MTLRMQPLKTLNHALPILALAYLAVGQTAHASYVDQICLGECKTDCGAVCVGGSKGACVRACARDNKECEAGCVRPGDPQEVTQGGSGMTGGVINGLTYGEYCGPGHGDRNYTTIPVDPVDEVCMAHDLCYDNRGYSSCGCDREMLLSLPIALALSSNPAAHVAGVAAASFFGASPCLCYICTLGVCLPYAIGAGGIGPC